MTDPACPPAQDVTPRSEGNVELPVLRHLPWRSRPLVSGLAVLAVLALAGWSVQLGWCHLGAAWHHRQAEQAQARGDLTGERAHLALCLEGWPDSGEVHFAAARAARRAGAYDEARDHLAHCRRVGWPAEAIALEAALLEAEQEGPDQVEDYLLACVHKDHPDAVFILEALTRGYLKTFHQLRALECLDLWLHRRPDDVQALVWRGEVRERFDNSAGALEDLRRAVVLDPNRDDARLRLGRLLLVAELASEALPHYEHLAQSRPGDPEAQLGLAMCQRRMERREEAQQLLDLILAAQPRHPAALAERGQVALDAGQFAEAESWLRKAVAVAPYERSAVYSLAQCLLRQPDKASEGRRLLTRVQGIDADLKQLSELMRQIARAPRDPGLRREAGALMLRNGQEVEGLRWLDSALKLDPRHGPTHQTLAAYYAAHGQPARSARHRQLAGVAAPAGGQSAGRD
jgi:predicted Zn-dependent protease